MTCKKAWCESFTNVKCDSPPPPPPPRLKVNWGNHTEKAIHLPFIGHMAWKCENHQRSWPANLLQVLNSTLDP